VVFSRLFVPVRLWSNLAVWVLFYEKIEVLPWELKLDCDLKPRFSGFESFFREKMR